MAIFHWSCNIISRAKCGYATAAAAYISGTTITSDYDGRTHDYSDRKDVAYKEIFLPDNAPSVYMDRETLWKSVEMAEKGSRAQQARSINAALPMELNLGEQIGIVRDYVKQFTNAGMCADVAIHDKKDGNPHVHILLTMRPLNGDGTWGNKSRREYELDGEGNRIFDQEKGHYRFRPVRTTGWDDRSNVERWRATWALCVNRKLRDAGVDAVIDHRSYERQGKHRIPSMHMGKRGSYLASHGFHCDRSDLNEEIIQANASLARTEAYIATLSRDYQYTAGRRM